MIDIKSFLIKKLSKAMISSGISKNFVASINQSSKNQKFGDYQIACIIQIAKKMNISSIKLAKKVYCLLDLHGIGKKKLVNPGFINIYLYDKWIIKNILKCSKSRILIRKTDRPKKIIVDYSSPNVAKNMHIGHLRSTVIGDSIVRILNILGHKVIRVNHIGDWGTQFGMLIAFLKVFKKNKIQFLNLDELDSIYKKSKKLYESNERFAKLSRRCVVKLQQGNKYCRMIWKKLVSITLSKNQEIYNRMNILLNLDDVKGESAYQSMLKKVVSDLVSKGIAIKSKGAIVIHCSQMNKSEKKYSNSVIVIQKQDGGYLYSTTDIACLKYRCQTLKAERILYYTDSRQKSYMSQIISIAKMAGYIPKSVSVEHHSFGMMLGDDKKPFKSRSGKTIILSKLLDEAVNKARSVLDNRNFISDIEKKEISNSIGIGAIKYFDLSKNKKTDYVFNWDKILSFNGNTSCYLQYAYTRIVSILKKSDTNICMLPNSFILTKKIERNLAVHLLQFEEKIKEIENNGLSNVLCLYLYKLSNLFSIFYKDCSVIYEKTVEVKNSRLKLIFLTKRILKTGLNLLGIDEIRKM
ncbi:hypothetical protein AOQ88_01050 [Candidatus Riesia sp. GBBU]|nr:hypothetical protein AOQ88_01050 [Candidatus Riesia sp. GBBU]